MEDNNIQDSCCNSKYASIRQMDKLDEMLGRRFPFYPRTVIQAVHDGRTGASLEAILAQYNNIYVQYQGTAGRTRNIVPKEMRRKGIIISYVDMQGNAITEKCVNDAQRDNFHWGLDVNWVRVDELTLSGDISVSVKGTWVINGEDTGIAALGPKGDNGLTPWLKTIDNKLHFSYDNETWEVCSDYIAAYFRFQDNKFQISRDNKTWSDLSGEVTNSLSIKAYVTDKSQYPNPKQGDMIMVGPTYADDDTEHTKPIYHLNIYNAGGWVDHGPFQSINAGVVQELGNSETEVMSQKAVSEKISELALQDKILKNVTGIIQGEYNTGGDKVENNHNANILQMVDINSHEGDRYLCLGYASQNYRLWAFTDADGNILTKSKSTDIDLTDSGEYCIAPKGTVKAIFSCYISYKDKFAIYKNGQINDINERLEKVEPLLGITYKLDHEAEHFTPQFYDSNESVDAKYKTNGDAIIESFTPEVKQIIDTNAYPGCVYSVKGYGGKNYRLYAFVNKENIIIEKDLIEEHDSSNSAIIVEAPSGTVKAIFSSYTSYPLTVSKNNVSIRALKTMDNDLSDISNIIHETYPGRYDTSGSILVETSPNYAVNQIIDNTEEGAIYAVRGYGGNSYRLWAFTDADGNVIEKSAQGLDESKSAVLLEAPSGAVKAIFSSYVAYPLTVSKNGMFTQILSNKSHLSRKRAAFCGDSIMIGQDNKESVKSLTYYISKKTNLKCTNWAKGGSVILYPFYTGNAYSIYWQLTQVDKNSDYIILQGGVNGVNLNDSGKPNYAPMGRITEGFDEELQLNTQIGCLEAICRYAITQFPGKKIGFIITYDISNYEYWRDKVVKFKEVLDKWGIPYLDWRHSGINLASYDIRAIYGVDTWSEYEEYSNKKTYKTDDKVIYQSKAYKANQDIDSPEEWDSSKWTLISSDRYDGWHCNSLAYQLLADKTIKWMESL